MEAREEIVLESVLQPDTAAPETAVSITAALDAGRPAFLIGSDPRAHLVIAEAVASHAIIVRRQNEYFVQARFPNAAVLVNGKRISAPKRLLPGDALTIGSMTVHYDQREAASAPAIVPAPKPAAKPAVVFEPVAAPAAASPASVTAAPAEPVSVYYPKGAEPARMRPAAALAGFFTLAVILGAVFAIVSGGVALPSASEALPVDYAYNDGNVTLLMFDADW